jgi:hypothetical protein
VLRAVPEVVPIQHGTDLGAAQRQPEVAALTGGYGIDGEPTGVRGGLGEDFFG